MAILFDKSRLQRGESTANIAVDATLEVLQRRAMQARGAQPAIPVLPEAVTDDD
jgi:hypothetical protein